MAHFPVYMDLKGAPVFVLGGGKVASRKITTLIKYEADIYVASTDICPEITEVIAEDHRFLLSEETAPAEELKLLESQLNQARLVIAASGNHDLNRLVGHYCRDHHILANVIDAPELCSFVFPSVVVRGDISIGINTGTKSPALSKQIRKDIEEMLPDYYEELALQLADLRDYVKANFETEKDRRRILKTAAADAFAKKRVLTQEEIMRILEGL